jgi:cytochrome c-type biogenesis protein CcmH
VHSCNHLQCGSALPLRDEIRAQMAEGKDREAILDHFRQKYGEKILSSPTTTGFNLAAWITPFFMVAAGALLLVFTVRRWGRRGDAAEASGPRPLPVTSSEHQKILERELEDFDK